MRAWVAVLVVLLLVGVAAVGWGEQISRVSVNYLGEQADGIALDAAISADGSTIAFLSSAGNMIPEGNPTYYWVFCHDRVTGALTWPTMPGDVSQLDLTYAPDFSADGRYVAYTRAHNSATYISTAQVYDRLADTVEQVSVGMEGAAPNGSSGSPSISADGRYVAFSSRASNLTADDTNGVSDVFVYDRTAGTTRLVSRGLDGLSALGSSSSPSLSADGHFVAFVSEAANLVPSDTNGLSDVFVCDLTTMTLERASVTWDGGEANGAISWGPQISGDGRYVAFSSGATNLLAQPTSGYQVWRRDRQQGVTERVSVGMTGAGGTGNDATGMSDDGRCVVFSMWDGGMVPEVPAYDGHVHFGLRDMVKGRTVLLDATQEWVPGNGGVRTGGDITADGRYAVFSSLATDLVPGDTNDADDVFLVDRQLFSDIPVDQWAYYEIRDCVRHGIVKGYQDGSYAPKDIINRGQMAAYLARALCDGDGNVPTGPATPTFIDVPVDAPFYNHIEYAYAHGILTGYPFDNTYRPGEPVNRGQMAAFLARAKCGGEELVPSGPAEASFPDVAPDFKFYRHIEWIYAQGITTGYKSDGLYHPEYACPRDQMAVFVARAFDLASTAP